MRPQPLVASPTVTPTTGPLPSLVGDSGTFRAEIARTRPEPGLELITVTLTAERAARPPALTLTWNEPLVNVAAYWTTSAGSVKPLHADWAGGWVSAKATSQAPVVCLISGGGDNRLCIACSDALHHTRIKSGVVEESGELVSQVRLFGGARAEAARFEVVVRIDRRSVRFERALGEVSTWWDSACGYKPAPVPVIARLPMYSTWYSFHQPLDTAAVEEQCRIAKGLGCAAVIVDDGWQTMDAGRGYAYCGDWRPERIPDMAGHVARVHALGMKFLLWYSVPYVGIHSRAFQQFRSRLLRIDDGIKAGVLDPRFPEVREHLIATWEKAVAEWDLDGLKLDFVDSFSDGGEPAEGAVGGRDLANIDEAVDRLLSQALARLRARKPDFLIEFRQSYIGPVMRTYGNMFRAGDCPADALRNRTSTVDIRLLCGDTACHGDMLMWHPAEPVESAALQLTAVLFSVPQISVRLDRIPEEHREMVGFYLAFWREHRDALLDGELRAESPELGYPLVAAAIAGKRVAVAYAAVTVPLGSERDTRLVNATRGDQLTVSCARDLGERRVRVHDCRGRLVSDGQRRFAAGAHALAVPPAGIASISPA
ncbi:MAG: alpha-galactosidase [Planctomycetes bacterium]|nr:alpha-galactosidase [Planctomycetota bacterium]